jgi:phenylacetate-CoA ligase
LGYEPRKLQTSGGTTGMPRPTMFGPVEWEMNGLTFARGLHVQGARPGDILQIPATASLANFAWCVYKASHDYMGIMPLTTGSGIVTPSRRQLEIAFAWGTNLITSFPEYLTQLAKVARDELRRDVRDLKLRFLQSFLGPDVDNSLRNQLEKLWGCPVYDHYGTHELGLGAFECRQKNGLHLMEDATYFEVIDSETGRLVEPGIAGVYPMACLPAVKSDARTTGEWFCIADRHVSDGAIRDEMTVQVELRRDAGSREGLQEHLERRLHADLGVRVAVELVEEGALTEVANLGREGKPRRLLDRRNVRS